ncbi:MAG: hypothetical protein H7Z12_01820 [Rhodospirillaceae bacterium]|nr:hypothetical protein [Rhodospirillales bacterium]
MASNQNDIVAATDAQQTDGALLVGGNGDDLLLADGTQTWTGTFTGQNGSGVSGTVNATLTGTTLAVQVQATGLEPNQSHAAHIHGLSSQGDAAQESSLPFDALDKDADGFIELNEGQVTVGPAILPLTAVGGQFPTAGADGSLNFTSTFNLANLPQGTQAADLFPLDMRTVELHGLTVTAADGRLTAGEVNGTAGYKATLPVAAAELTDADAAGGTTAVLRGDNGGDTLIGDTGNDLLLGSQGNDVLAGLAGDDQLVGGSGRDTFIVGQGSDVVVDFQTNQDKLSFSTGTTDTVQASSTSEGILLTAGDSTILLMGVQANMDTLDLSNWIA